jgi:hypothetical protein
MAAERKYPEELRESLVKMVSRSETGTGMGTASRPGWVGSWYSPRSTVGPGSGRKHKHRSLQPTRAGS